MLTTFWILIGLAGLTWSTIRTIKRKRYEAKLGYTPAPNREMFYTWLTAVISSFLIFGAMLNTLF